MYRDSVFASLKEVSAPLFWSPDIREAQILHEEQSANIPL
jgi:hypothetical protein